MRIRTHVSETITLVIWGAYIEVRLSTVYMTTGQTHEERGSIMMHQRLSKRLVVVDMRSVGGSFCIGELVRVWSTGGAQRKSIARTLTTGPWARLHNRLSWHGRCSCSQMDSTVSHIGTA